MSSRMGEFTDRNCKVIGISTDTIETHIQWLRTSPTESGLGNIRFPLAADVGGKVCQKYSVYDDKQDLALRGLFLIDPNGVLQHQVTHNLNVGRSTDEVLRVLDAVQNGGLCPAEKTAASAIRLHDAARPNHIIGNYRIMSKLGEGAFGSVFLAQDRVLQRSVALKILKVSDQQRVRSLVSEARAAANLHHPNFCIVHTVDQYADSNMIVMEYIKGETLEDRINRDKELDPVLAAYIVFQVADAMATAHSRGVAHGDLKPANLMLTETGGIKIMDFGLARVTLETSVNDETLDRNWASLDTSRLGTSETGSSLGLAGTPRYMSPNLIEGGSANSASDVHALGLILYEITTGKPAINSRGLLDTIRQVSLLDGERLAEELPSPIDQIVRGSVAADSDSSQENMQLLTMSKIADRLRGIASQWRDQNVQFSSHD